MPFVKNFSAKQNENIEFAERTIAPFKHSSNYLYRDRKDGENVTELKGLYAINETNLPTPNKRSR